MSGRNDGLGLGRGLLDDPRRREEGRRFFERRMASGDEAEWTRWHEEGRWAEPRNAVGRATAAVAPGSLDRFEEGAHAGKGPRGLHRTEERFRELVCEVLTRDGWVDATDIDVRVEGADVTLTGTVADRTQKRRAEDVVYTVHGVRDVHNRLRVREAALP